MKSKPKIAENIEKPSENLFSNNSQHTDKSSCGIHSILQRILKNEIFLRQPNKESYKFYRELYFQIDMLIYSPQYIKYNPIVQIASCIYVTLKKHINYDLLFEKTLSPNPVYSKAKKRRKSSENLDFNQFQDKIADLASDDNQSDGEIYYPMNKYNSIANPQRKQTQEVIKIEDNLTNITPSNMYILENDTNQSVKNEENLDQTTKPKHEEYLLFEKNIKLESFEVNYQKNEVINFQLKNRKSIYIAN